MARERGAHAVKILILGGTLFLGRHLVESARTRGHEVTLFNRGRTNPELFPEVEKLRGDRESGDLEALRDRRWDAVIDTSGYVPRIVGESAELLAGAVDRYAFVSSLSVFTPPAKQGLTEGDSVTRLADEGSEDVQAHYGPLKALCEQVVESAFPGRALNLRSGLLIGPHDPTNRFEYWVHRVARGGDVLAPDPSNQPVQLIDVRDFSDWTIRLLESHEAGTFHATGKPVTLSEMLDECRAAAGSDARFVWIHEQFLLREGVEPPVLPLWVAPLANPDWRGFFDIDVTKALAHGLELRPLRESARDVLETAEPPPRIKFGVQMPPAGLEPAREAELLAAWKRAA
jgi:2'-hydroxyisoflavone reductase